MAWPECNDHTTDIDTFKFEFTNLLKLGNYGYGYPKREEVLLLGTMLKQSRKRAYEVILKRARSAGRSCQCGGNPSASSMAVMPLKNGRRSLMKYSPTSASSMAVMPSDQMSADEA